MTTIPQRLRECVDSIRASLQSGIHYSVDFVSALQSIEAIASELEAPAADAVPVVAYIYTETGAFAASAAKFYQTQFAADCACKTFGGEADPLIRERDHLATVAALQATIASQKAALIELTVENEQWASDFPALQARINALEARQWFLADETDDAQDDVWSDAADAYAKAAGALRGHLEWRDRIRAAVRVLIASGPQPDTSKEQS